MSDVFSVVIVTQDSPFKAQHNIEILNDWLVKNEIVERDFTFKPVCGDVSSGNKYPEFTLYWGGFSYIDSADFVAMFKSLNWLGSVLIIKDAATYQLTTFKVEDEAC